ncbi:MAG: LamG-like jellyroll fold domain-containing protein [Planctomycetota bacterium]|jgi:hypothetical protein
MSKKLIFLISMIFVLGVISPCMGQIEEGLVGWWTFDGHVDDVSGNGRNGILVGNPGYGPGFFGQAIEFDGDDYVSIEGYQGPEDRSAHSFTAWIKTTTGTNNAIICWGSTGGGNRVEFRIFNDVFRWNTGNGNVEANTSPTDGEWHHVAVTLAEGTAISSEGIRIYVDGVDDTITSSDTSDWGVVPGEDLAIGLRVTNGDRYFIGSIDDVRFYDRVLTPEEVVIAMETSGEPYPFAFGPSPADNAQLSDTWTTLEWSPGAFAVSHNIYFGDNFDDVNEGMNDTLIGSTTDPSIILGFPGFAYSEGLIPNTTYYWRVDEVNDVDPNSPWKGKVWSFWIQPDTAYDRNPADAATFADPNVDLSWKSGSKAVAEAVYFGTDAEEVANATGGAPLMNPTYDPGPLALDTTYYWRVDTFDGSEWLKSDVWSLKTLPDVDIPVADPNLVGWWKFEEGVSSLSALDASGYNNHGSLVGNPMWTEGYDGEALELDGDDYISIKDYKGVLGASAISVSIWLKTSLTAEQQLLWWGTDSGGQRVEFRVHSNGHIRIGNGGGQVESLTDVTNGQWHHIVATVEENATNSSTQVRIYLDGQDDTLESTDDDPPYDVSSGLDVTIGYRPSRNDRAVQGLIDDVRIYDKVLTATEVEQIMRIDLNLAWNPNPASGSMPDIENATPLSWTAGDMATQHDVYFSPDRNAVKNADTSTTDVYRGRQNGTSYTPPEGVEWGGGPYYWRIDEINTDGTVTKGRAWSFTVADYILIDDFESYDAGDNQIWYTWNDGIGYGLPDFPPYFAGNGTGAAVGDENTASYTEETIVYGGNQSMPFWYDNNAQGKSKYSETQKTLIAPRDWSKHEVAELSLWFRGYPPIVSSFTEAPAGTYTMTASGTDITGTADEFHYAYKTLNGPGSIIARVQSVSETHAWAKAGVMIRETLDPNSTHAMVCVTPGNGVAFQGRTTTGGSSFSSNETEITAPHWVKLERDVMGNFTASHSADGSTWIPVGNSVPTLVTMSTNVYVGLALTSHNTALTCEAIFSNVTITGVASQQWTNQDIGILGNDAEPLYTALSNAAGTPAIVYHDDENAATIDTWTEWVIPLQAFADQGLDLADVDTIAIGLGTQGNMTIPGGSGKMFFDDIRLYRLRPEPEPQP